MRWNGFLATTITALVAFAAPAAADTFTVATLEDAGGTCADPQACTSIRQAITSAAQTDGQDLINVPPGVYQLSLGALAITDNPSAVTITGAGARDTTIVAAESARVLELDGVQATIANLTVQGGTATNARGFFGGNVWAIHSNVLVDHVRSTGGQASSGGGIANRNGSMLIQNSLIDNNTALMNGGDGGGIINFGGDNLGPASLTIRDSTIAFNAANLIGGVTQYGSDDDSLTLESVTIARNSTGFRGGPGGLNVGQGTASVRGSIIASNHAGDAPNCATAAMISQGSNVSSDATCKLNQLSDRSGVDVRLNDALTEDGGQTDVLTFGPASPAFDIGGQCSALDQTDIARTIGPCDAGAWERRLTMTSGPTGLTNNRRPTFTFAGAASSGYECMLEPVESTRSPCSSPLTPASALPDGDYTLHVFAEDESEATRSFTVDATAPAAPQVSGDGGQYAFQGEAGATLQCALNGGAYEACSSPYSAQGLAPGQYTLAIRAVDTAGNAGPPAVRSFAIAGQPPIQTPTPVPTATPTATATPTPLEPVRNRSVAAEPEGTVLIKRGGKFVPLTDAVVPNGSEIDAKDGSVKITTSAGEVAVFYAGRFKISQTGGLTTLTLSEPLDCRKAKRNASAAAKKPRTRKLWGDGKGRFRTKGTYSAATVRGTKWLVQDTCTTTLTRVAQGVVSVRDDVLKKTLSLRKGKSYTARAKKK